MLKILIFSNLILTGCLVNLDQKSNQNQHSQGVENSTPEFDNEHPKGYNLQCSQVEFGMKLPIPCKIIEFYKGCDPELPQSENNFDIKQQPSENMKE